MILKYITSSSSKKSSGKFSNITKYKNKIKLKIRSSENYSKVTKKISKEQKETLLDFFCAFFFLYLPCCCKKKYFFSTYSIPVSSIFRQRANELKARCLEQNVLFRFTIAILFFALSSS